MPLEPFSIIRSNDYSFGLSWRLELKASRTVGSFLRGGSLLSTQSLCNSECPSSMNTVHSRFFHLSKDTGFHGSQSLGAPSDCSYNAYFSQGRFRGGILWNLETRSILNVESGVPRTVSDIEVLGVIEEKIQKI